MTNRTIEEVLTSVNADLKYYEVITIGDQDNTPIICEDGEYRVRAGYGVRNLLTGVVEHTTTLLPGAIFQSQHLSATLDGLLNPVPAQGLALEDMPVEDVTVAN